MIVVDVLTGAALLTGCLLALLASVGLHRFPDVFCRMHAATKPATLGLFLVAFAVALQLPGAGSLIKLFLVVALQFLTSPVGAHMVGRAAHRTGRLLSDQTVVDDLATARARERRPQGAS